MVLALLWILVQPIISLQVKMNAFSCRLQGGESTCLFSENDVSTNFSSSPSWRSSLCVEKNKIQDGLKRIRSSNWLLVLWQDFTMWMLCGPLSRRKALEMDPDCLSYCLKINTAFKALGNMQTCHCYKMRFFFRRTVFVEVQGNIIRSFSHRTLPCVKVADRSCSNKLCVPIAYH